MKKWLFIIIMIYPLTASIIIMNLVWESYSFNGIITINTNKYNELYIEMIITLVGTISIFFYYFSTILILLFKKKEPNFHE